MHAENYFGAGGLDRHVLERVRSRYPVSLHGVGLAIGSAEGWSPAHLEKLAALVERVEPILVSEHLCWGAKAGGHLNDLLPLAHTRETLELVAGRVHRVQDRLRRRLLVENVSAYVAFPESEMGEGELLAELARRTGCGLLLDVNNLHVNEVNHGASARAQMDALRAESIIEIHLAGHALTEQGAIDDHGDRVAAPVWRLFEEAIERFGPRPTLVEWDTSVPPLQVLLEEAGKANARLERQHAVAACSRSSTRSRSCRSGTCWAGTRRPSCRTCIGECF